LYAGGALGMSSCHTGEGTLAAAKVAITIDEHLLERIDTLVAHRKFPNRSRAIQEAVREKLERLDRSRLARECAKLNPKIEQKLADEGLAGDLSEWPEY
jgi:Arc/MetJ-type ribon-helix-helix transcriptional regulator